MTEVWQLMPAEKFSLIIVPFQGKFFAKVTTVMSLDLLNYITCSQESLCEIPSPYKEEMEKRKR